MRRTKQKRVKNPSKFVANVLDLFTWVCSQGSNCVCRAALVLAHASVKVVLAQIFQYMDHRFVIFSVQSWLQTSPHLHPNVWLQTPSVPVCVHECTLSIFLHIARLPSKNCWNAVTFALPNHPIKSACTVSTWHFLHVSCRQLYILTVSTVRACAQVHNVCVWCIFMVYVEWLSYAVSWICY